LWAGNVTEWGLRLSVKPADIYVSLLAAGFESLLVEPVWGEKEAIGPGDVTGKNAVSPHVHKSK
jgi:hypothetical protein